MMAREERYDHAGADAARRQPANGARQPDLPSEALLEERPRQARGTHADAARHLRADAERNRRRVLEAARALVRERGLEVGVAEIAERAGVGRGTLFRNFPTKEDLIAAIVVEGMREVTARGWALVQTSVDEDAGEVLFEFLAGLVAGHQSDRALFEAIGDVFLSNQEVRAIYYELVQALDALVTRAQEAGAIRRDIGSVDLMMMVKGVCLASEAFQGVDDEVPLRALDLVRWGLGAPAAGRPLRGQTLTFADYGCVPPGQATGRRAQVNADPLPAADK